MRPYTKLFCILICVSAPSIGSAEMANVKNGKQLFDVCQSCHGVNGEGVRSTGAPRLTGVQDWYLIRQLRKFRSGVRGANSSDKHGQQMVTIANTLPDDQAVLDVVAYILTLRRKASTTSSPTGDSQGEKTSSSNCLGCSMNR